MKKILFLASIFALTIFISLGAGGQTEGASEAEINGFAWSSNIGWISFSGDTYGVIIDQQGGNLSGYAWSSNIGWISFEDNDLVGCPENPCRAKLDGTSFSGWAKALAADGEGWDGWMHLSGSNYGLEVESNGDITGFMWGGPVLGWISSYDLNTILGNSCDDGEDNDNDGYADADDIDCGLLIPPNDYDAPGTETVYNPQCHNGHEDETDGYIDFGADRECDSLEDDDENDPTPTPVVEVFVGLSNDPSFENILIGKENRSVNLKIEIGSINSPFGESLCKRIVTRAGNSPVETILNTTGQQTYDATQSLSIPVGTIGSTKVTVTCTTGSKTGSDSVDILIKSQNEF